MRLRDAGLSQFAARLGIAGKLDMQHGGRVAVKQRSPRMVARGMAFFVGNTMRAVFQVFCGRDMMAGRLLVVQGRFEMMVGRRRNRRQRSRRIRDRRMGWSVRCARAIGLVGMVLRPQPVAARSHRLMRGVRIIFADLVVPRSFDMTGGRLRMMARGSAMLESGQILFRHGVSSKSQSTCSTAKNPATLAPGGALASVLGRRSGVLLVGLCGLMMRLLAMLKRLLRALPSLFHLAVGLAFDGLLMLLGRHLVMLGSGSVRTGIGSDTRTRRDGGGAHAFRIGHRSFSCEAW